MIVPVRAWQNEWTITQNETTYNIMRTRIEVRSRATGKLITSHEENRRMTAKEIEKAKRDCMRNLDHAKVTAPEVTYIED